MAKRVDGVYDSDPLKNQELLSTRSYHLLTYQPGAWRHGFHRRLALHGKRNTDYIFNLLQEGNIKRALMGEPVGTWIGRVRVCRTS